MLETLHRTGIAMQLTGNVAYYGSRLSSAVTLIIIFALGALPDLSGVRASEPVAEKGAAVPSAPPQGAKPPYGKVHVLAVGINQYPRGEDRLSYATNDARKVAQVLAERYAFTNVSLLLDRDATRAQIFSSLERIGSQLSPDARDDFIFYFSGHGVTGKEILDQAERPHGFLLPYTTAVDLSTTNLAELREHAVELKDLMDRVMSLQSARHRIVFLDSCFSGLAFKGQKVLSRFPTDAYESVLARPTVQLLTAGLEHELAREDMDLQQGVFTKALLRQLEEPRVRTIEEVFFPLRADVRNYFVERNRRAGMTPQHRYLVYDEGTFVFVPPKYYSNWAANTPRVLDNAPPTVRLADYQKKVELAELRKVKYERYSFSDEELAAQKERFEYRASIGDPIAALATSEMYRLGLGAPRDPARSKLWRSEVTAASDANLVNRDIYTAFAALEVWQGMQRGAISAQSIGEIIRMTDRTALQSFAEVLRDLREELTQRKRSSSLDKCQELKKLLNEIREENPGKVTAEEGEELTKLIDLVTEQIRFGVYDAALEDLADAPAILNPIQQRLPGNSATAAPAREEERPKRRGLSIPGIPGFKL